MATVNFYKKVLNEFDDPLIFSKLGSDSIDTIRSYFNDKLTEQKKKDSGNLVKVAVTALSLLAALAILSGITLVVVNFNWEMFTDKVKTILSYILLAAAQIIGGVILYKKSKSVLYREIGGIIVSFMFGVVIYFIGQIYQLPSNEQMFLLIWAISTIAVAYIMNSISAVVLYLVLIILCSLTFQYQKSVGAVVYPLLLLIVPFYIINYRQRSVLRVRFLDYSIIIALVVSVGIAIEKAIPGLWIVVYSSMFSCFYIVGTLFGKSKESTPYFSSLGRFLNSPYRWAGVAGVAVMGGILSFVWPFENIGWHFIRTNEGYNLAGTIPDILFATILPLLSLAGAVITLPIDKFSKFFKSEESGGIILNNKPVINPIVSFFGFAVAIFYLVIAGVSGREHTIMAINTAILTFSILLSVYGTTIGLLKNNQFTGYISMLYGLIVFMLYSAIRIESYDSGSIMIAGGSVFCVLFYIVTIFYKSKSDTQKNKLLGFISGLSIFALVSLFYTLSYGELWDWSETRHNIGNPVLMIIDFVITAALGGAALYLTNHLKKNGVQLISKSISFAGVFVLFIILLIEAASPPAFFTGILMLLYLIYIGVDSFLYGYKHKSIPAIFFSSLLLLIVILSRFLIVELGNILINGIVLILLGCAFVTVNIIFIKKIKRG